MRKICMLMLLSLALAFIAGCASNTDPGSREYIPGTGWVPMPN